MVLENKLGIKSSSELMIKEEKISKRKAKELFELDLVSNLKAGSFEALSFIHKYLFDEIYDFLKKSDFFYLFLESEWCDDEAR